MEAIQQNLINMGVLAMCEDDNIFILPGRPKGCTIETYEDHRVAMAFAIVGTVIEGVEIKNPSCTGKTFEQFFEVLERDVY
jgi:3-phosphoshikimate 1-carboxyvinyltransferase